MFGRIVCGAVTVMLTAQVVINVGMNFLLIPTYGIMGAAISWAVAILVRNVLPLAMINRMLGMSPFGSASAWVAVTAVACVSFVPALLRVSGAPFTAVVTATVIGGLAYLALLWVARHRLQLTAFGAIVKRRDVA